MIHSPSVPPPLPAFVASGPEAVTLYILPVTALLGLSLSITSGGHKNIRQLHKHNQSSPLPSQSFCLSQSQRGGPASAVTPIEPPNGDWHMN